MTTQAVTSPFLFSYQVGQRSLLKRKLRNGHVERTRTFKEIVYLRETVKTNMVIKKEIKEVDITKRKYLVKPSGNGCFHDKNKLRTIVQKNPYDTKLGEDPVTHEVELHKFDAHGNKVHTKKLRFDTWGNKLRMKAQYKAIQKTSQYFHKPSTLPSIAVQRNAAKRREGKKAARTHRSESREAVCRVLEVLMLNVDVHSLRIGSPDKTDTQSFHYTTNESLAAQSGVSSKQMQRTLDILHKSGCIGIKLQSEKCKDGKYKGKASRIWFTRNFMKSMGLLSSFDRASEQIRNKARKSEERGVKTPEQVQAEATDQLCQAASGVILKGSKARKEFKRLNDFLDTGDEPPTSH